jgi:Mor family transcriptional regulator
MELSPAAAAARERRIARSVKYGMSLKEAARHYRMDDKRVRAICVAYGVKTPTVGQRGMGAA